MNTERKLGLGSVRVKKDELIQKLKNNLETHKLDYIESIDGFYIESEKTLKLALKNLKKKEIPNHISFVRPENHASDYEIVIEMLEMSVDEYIDLTTSEFKQYVQDKWNWSETFNNMKSIYASKG